MPDASSHGSDPRRTRVDGCPGLWKRQRVDGSTVFELKLRQGGVLISTTLGVATEAQARTAWKKASANRDEGGRPLTRDLRLSAVASEALADLEAKAVAGLRSRRTHRGYLTIWVRHLEPKLGRKRLARIGAQDILYLVADLREQGLAEWTCASIITTLRMILALCEARGLHDA